jgi:hypothetical protein
MAQSPAAANKNWMPWNYQQTLDGTVTPAGTAS